MLSKCVRAQRAAGAVRGARSVVYANRATLTAATQQFARSAPKGPIQNGVWESRRMNANISAPLAPEPPFTTVITYNQSKHATGSVLADIRAVWGDKIRVIQTLEEGLQRLPGMDDVIFVKPKSWGNMEHFTERLEWKCSQDHALAAERSKKEVVFMPGWSAFAESAEAARAVDSIGLVWPGTEPVASDTLEKIGFKRICTEVSAPTPDYRVITEEGEKIDLQDATKREALVQRFIDVLVKDVNDPSPGLIKSIHGGGGKGTAHLTNPTDPDEVRASVEKVLNEMNRSDGIYFEKKVNQKGDGRFFQLELEVDGDVVADGGRFVWFNSRLQKVVEIGLSDEHVPLFMPPDLYAKSRAWASEIARAAKNNTRATMEGLVFTNEHGEHELSFIECNRRPQVENEALALLQMDSKGNRRYTFAELMMRAKGYPAPTFERAKDCEVVLHARWLHGNPDQNGNITYQPGVVSGFKGPRLDFVKAEMLAPGEISFTSDPQLGKSVIIANSWEEMCDNAVKYFTLRKPVVQGSSATYATAMLNLFSLPLFREGKVASNETFKYLDIPDKAPRTIIDVLEEQVSPVLVKGYRPGQGVDVDRYPTPTVCSAFEELSSELMKEAPRATTYTKFARGEASYEDYVKDLRAQLEKQGGGWVTVGPRDTAQQGNDSESAALTAVSKLNAEVWGEKAGCVGYEIGGAQYQAGLIRGFDPAAILVLGLPYNMPAHSLQRSQYVNGLAELTPEIRLELFKSTADLVNGHYRPLGAGKERVPWHPYNFHAGNYYDAAKDYSPQDLSTGELLTAGCVPMPCWVFSAKFPLEALEAWTGRQIDLFAKHGMQLQQLRIKNPGQGKDWTSENLVTHLKAVKKVFDIRSMPPPIIYIHNHDFNGLGGHTGAEVFTAMQKESMPYVVIDACYRKNGTHNDNTVMTASLNLTAEQKDSLLEYNHNQQVLEQVLSRFDSRTSQMTPWDSDWAGGTEGSDIRIAKEYGLNPRHINHAKEVANEVFPLERAVTPFSEYKLRLGIGIMIEEGLQPKSAQAVRDWVNKGGKLKVGGDVLVGLKRWETLVPKTPEVDKLLANMPDELEAALGQQAKLVTPADLPANFTAAQKHNALGYQGKGLEFATKVSDSGADMTPLLTAPSVLHRQPRTLPAGTKFELLVQPGNFRDRSQVEFRGFGKSPKGEITMTYLHEGTEMSVALPDPDASVGSAASGPRKADPGNKLEFGSPVPGELLAYSVAEGDTLKAGAPLCVFESMKMEMKISVPDELDGLQVKSLPLKGRTKEKQGDMLSPGDLVMELKEAK
mmetsp:Transcript_53138/g.124477  ORF Transcript_53138/g.124477 Transcript_53138/m.124477 type:complete len:1295 (-) Transcript_53138:103-3987(-)